jgi:hypothetical protein
MPKKGKAGSPPTVQPVTRRKVLGYLAKGTVAAGIAMVHGSHDQAAGQTAPPPTPFGLVVYGGTPAGIMAAVAGVRGGISVAIVEPTNHLGGILTSGLGQTDSQYQQCIGGLAAQFYLDLGSYYGTPDTPAYFFEPHVAEAIFDGYISSAKVTVYFERSLTAITQTGNQIDSIALSDGTELAATEWIDASYEGDLMAASGATYVVGRESNTQYGESAAGFGFTPTVTPVSPYLPNQSLIPGVNPSPGEAQGAADSLIMAYTFRCCTTTNPSNMAPFPMPPGYTPSRYTGLAEYIATGVTELSQIVTMVPTQNQKYDLLWVQLPFSVNYVGGGWLYPNGTPAQRQQIWQDHYNYVAGWLYFVANDPSVPSSIQSEINEYGLALDEFTDNDNWPWQMYVREGRRLVGQYVMTQADITTNVNKPNVIAVGNWYGDCHFCDLYPGCLSVDGITVSGVIAEGGLDVSVQPYQIPFECLLPVAAQVQNLAVVCCLSSSHVGFSSLRVEPTFMELGEAAGAAAALAAGNPGDFAGVSIPALQNILSANGAIFALPILPIATLSATSIAFAPQSIDTASAPQSVTLTNTSTVPLSFFGFHVTGPNASSFVFAITSTATLAPGASYTIHGHCAPKTTGPLTATISISDTGILSPQTITLTGTGLQPVASLSAPSLTYVSQLVGTASASQSVTLTNTGNGTLSITGIQITGANASSFVFGNNCGSSVAPGASCTIHGHFAPTTAGALTAAIIINDNAGGSQTVALAGTGAAPAASLSVTSLAFAPQTVGTASPSQPITLTNTGNATLTITSVALSGANTSSFVFINDCGSSLAPGASGTIHVQFDPAAQGSLTAALTISDNVNPSPQTVALSGIGQLVALSVNSLSYGVQKVGTESASQSVTLTNIGSAPLAITSIKVTGPNASSFVFGNNLGSSLAAGATGTIHGHFAPAVTGPLAAAIVIVDSSPGSPQTIALSGTGIAPQASLSALSLAYGFQQIGTESASQSVTLTNTGSTALEVTAINVTGANASSFVFAYEGASSLAPGSSSTIHGHFAPTATGPMNAAIVITDNAGGSQTVALTGTGAIPIPSLSATRLAYGPQTVGTQSASQSVTVTNTGNMPVAILGIQVTGANASSFVIGNSLGSSLAPGASGTIHGHFAPTTTGLLTASIVLTTNAANSPQSITLTGTGQ